MTSKLFTGIGSFNDPSYWSPQGVPVGGDSASLSRGSAIASGVTLDDLTIGVTLNQDHGSFGMLSLQNVTLGARTLLRVFTENDTQDGPISSSLGLQGAITLVHESPGTLVGAG